MSKGALAVALSSLLVLGACASPGPRPRVAQASERVRASVQAMLSDRAAKLGGGDAEGYLQALGTAARATEEPIAHGVAGVALTDIHLTLGDADIDAKNEILRSAQVAFTYRYKDLPEDNPFRFELVYDLDRRDGAWEVTASRPGPGERLPPWATGPVAVTNTPHFLALSRPGLSGVDQLLALAEQARAQLVPQLTLVPDERHLLVLAADAAEFAQFVKLDGPAPPGLVALASAEYRQTAGHPGRPESRQMVADVAAVRSTEARATLHDQQDQPDVTPVKVFQHELAHLALSRFSRSTTPSWADEGAAMFLSGERRLQEWKADVRTGVLDALSLAAASRQRQLSGLYYPYANAVVLYLVETLGVGAFWEFYRNFKDIPMRGSIEQVFAEGTHRLLQRHYKLDEGQIDTRVKEWIRNSAVTG